MGHFPVMGCALLFFGINVKGPSYMSKQGYWSIVLLGIALLLTAFAIMVLFTIPISAGIGRL